MCFNTDALEKTPCDGRHVTLTSPGCLVVDEILWDCSAGKLGGVEKRRSDVSLPVANGQIFTWPPQSGLA